MGEKRDSNGRYLQGSSHWRGSRKGVQNNGTRILKEAFLQSFQIVGGVDFLTRFAEENPVAYVAALSKLLPREGHLQIGSDSRTEIELAVEMVRSGAIQNLQPEQQEQIRYLANRNGSAA